MRSLRTRIKQVDFEVPEFLGKKLHRIPNTAHNAMCGQFIFGFILRVLTPQIFEVIRLKRRRERRLSTPLFIQSNL